MAFFDLIVRLSITISCLMHIFSDFSPTKAKMQHISNISIGVMYIMYLLAALFGYLTFIGEDVTPFNIFAFFLHVYSDTFLNKDRTWVEHEHETLVGS